MSSKKLKKDLRRQVTEELSATMGGLVGDISPKKLKRNIKKASKILLTGVKIQPSDVPSVEKKKPGVEMTA